VRSAAAIGALVALAMPVGSANGAAPIGEAFAPSTTVTCAATITYLQAISPQGQYAAPSGGVITSWSVFAGPPPVNHFRLKVARPAGGDNFTIVGQSDLMTLVPSQLNTFLVRIPVEAGDVIGFSLNEDMAGCLRTPASGYRFAFAGGDLQPGTTATFNIAGPERQLDVSATLEPDCDQDGFGDESQDAVADCVTPETQITKGPKDKTRKRKATFEFSSSEPNVSFECSLDGKPFVSCLSPDTVKVKKGKHSFAVRARDAAGNLDGSPASDDWKVKKKRKR